MLHLTAPVGKMAKNQIHDVAAVQAALANAKPAMNGGSSRLWSKIIDGRATPELEAAIGAYQRGHDIPVTGKITPNDRTAQSFQQSLPADMLGMRAVRRTAAVFCADIRPGRIQQVLPAIREKTLLPRFASEPLERLADRVHRDLGLIIEPSTVETDHEGRFIQHFGFEKTRWLGRDGRPAPSHMPVPLDVTRAVLGCLNSCPGLEMVAPNVLAAREPSACAVSPGRAGRWIMDGRGITGSA